MIGRKHKRSFWGADSVLFLHLDAGTFSLWKKNWALHLRYVYFSVCILCFNETFWNGQKIKTLLLKGNMDKRYMTKCSVVVTNKYKFKESFSLLNRQKLQKPMCIVDDRYNETGIIYCSTDESIN